MFTLKNFLFYFLLIWNLKLNDLKAVNKGANKSVKTVVSNSNNSTKQLKRNMLLPDIWALQITHDIDTFEIDESDFFRTDYLNEFLSRKSFQYMDDINSLNIEMPISNYKIDIIKFNSSTAYDNSFQVIGNTRCWVNKYEIMYFVCPWHYVFAEREEMFPSTRAFAKCNCDTCNARTQFDTSAIRSRCRPKVSFMPVLILINYDEGIETWKFGLEEVPQLCRCSILIKPH